MEADFAERTIIIQQPEKLVFGNDCSSQLVTDFSVRGFNRVFIVMAGPVLPLAESLIDSLEQKNIQISMWDVMDGEPTIEMLQEGLEKYRACQADAVVGIGGGSVLDLSKLIAALGDGDQTIQDVFGIGQLSGRKQYLACLPTTSGTGSEVSPNAILLDQKDEKKKGVISEHLVPDAAYLDPMLTRTVPPAVTAATGMDAMVHCIEAYANRFAHPMINLYALEGIRLIAANLKAAVEDGENIAARTALLRGSLYGGLCLGPVNTGAVHALAYPLGGAFHISHGVSNALLLPYVMKFNLPAAPVRYARIAEALGEAPAATELESARRGLEKIRQLTAQCGIPAKMSELNLVPDDLERIAASAITVTRLLENNLREVTYNDALEIYREAW